MIVYRLAAKQYIDDRTGTGAKLFGGRWNPVGLACIYASEYISLALLEKFVHAEHIPGDTPSVRVDAIGGYRSVLYSQTA